MNLSPNMAGMSGDARPANRAFMGDDGNLKQFSVVTTSLETPPASAGAFSGFRVTLPIPPTTNNLFATTGKHRHRSAEYDEWLSGARHALRREAITPVKGRYAFLIALPDLMRGDCSNRIKAPEDLLVKEGLTPDDRHADFTAAYRSHAVSGAACIVTVCPIEHLSAALASVGGGPRPCPVNPPAGQG